MPVYKDTANNRKLKRVGMGYGKECSPCKIKEKSTPKSAPKGSHRMPDGSTMKDSDMKEKSKKKNLLLKPLQKGHIECLMVV